MAYQGDSMITIQTINPGSFNRDRARELGFAQWGAAFIDINEHEAGDQRYIRAYFTDAAPVTQNQVDAFVAALNPNQLATSQLAAKQHSDALAAGLALLSGSLNITARDAAYVVVARSYAIANAEP